MSHTASSNRRSLRRGLELLAGLGMVVFAALTVRHFFQANYPASIFEGSFCDINAFFNCDSSAHSPISALAGVPIGWFGMALGGLVALGSLCLLCTGYYAFSFLALGVYWTVESGPLGGAAGRRHEHTAPDSPLHRWLKPAGKGKRAARPPGSWPSSTACRGWPGPRKSLPTGRCAAPKTFTVRPSAARRAGLDPAALDPESCALVDRLMRTGAEYEKTHEDFAYGIRSTPTMIINNRMVIGTLPYAHLRAIFQALVDEEDRGDDAFLEDWQDTGG